MTSCVCGRAHASLLLSSILSSRSPSAVSHDTSVTHSVPILVTHDVTQHTSVAFRTRSIGFARSRLLRQVGAPVERRVDRGCRAPATEEQSLRPASEEDHEPDARVLTGKLDPEETHTIAAHVQAMFRPKSRMYKRIDVWNGRG